MSPAEHYAEAERLTKLGAKFPRDQYETPSEHAARRAAVFAEAQVHATLANAARAYSVIDPTWEDQ